jgi:ATP-dependent protease ClpP protease subunit
MAGRQSYQQKSNTLHDIHDYCVDIANRTIFLHAYIGESEDPGVDYRMSARFIKNLHFLNNLNQTKITIHLQTIGGDWHEGMAIYDAMKASKSKIEIVGHGSVSSMGSIIMQAAHKRLLMPSAEFMVHYGDVALDTTSAGARTAVNWLDVCNRRMLSIYVNACYGASKFKNQGKEEIHRFLDRRMRLRQDWYLTAKEAVAYGFIDGVVK